ncbi:MAG: Ig-like domain-containing protein [Bacteroidota bacterium]
MTRTFLLLTTLFLVFNHVERASAQVPGCGTNVPFFSVDLRGNSSGVWTSPNHSRVGNCCTSSHPDRCTSFQVLVDTGAAMIKLEVISGATPSGSMYYQVGCSTPLPIASPISISGYGPFNLTFCKPGNNTNTYRISTIPRTVTAISGTASIYVCSQTTLSCGVAGGTWSSNNTSVATVNTTSGIVTGVSAGVANITYTINASMVNVKTVTVMAIPSIAGTLSVCTPATSTLSNSLSGGTWSSSNTGVATITSAGVVSGVASGTARITYTRGTGCFATTVVSVNTSLPAITGTRTICTGAATTLDNTTDGGTWSSSNTSVATINTTTGVATGVAAGTATVSYRIGSCAATAVVTVNAQPAAISGATGICLGSTGTLTNAVSGGTWASSNASVATIAASTGVVTAVTAGTATVTYTATPGCIGTKQITVNALPSISGGTSPICDDQTTTLSTTISGGTWSSSNTAIATVSSAGAVTGTGAGTATITYQLAGGCTATAAVTINATPSNISGSSSICAGAAITLTNTLSGGTWVSADTTKATINATGVLVGIAAGNIVVSYTTEEGCFKTKAISVNATPAIAGAAQVCKDDEVFLTGTPAGGSWSSSNNDVADIHDDGKVDGKNAGTATISYQLGACRATMAFTVGAKPSSISGPSSVCNGDAITLTNTISGGTWSADSSLATINAATGVLTGIATGTTIVTFTAPAGCIKTKSVTVKALPVVTGTDSVCQAGTISLSSSLSGSNWSSSNTAVATVNGEGEVTGISAGSALISFVASGCASSKTITIIAAPSVSTPAVCTGETTTIGCSATGGAWSCNSYSVASLDTVLGTVTGVAAGTARITYTAPTGCTATAVLTVNGTPTISGTATVCQGKVTTLTASVSGGTWACDGTGIVTVAGAGIITALASGNATVSYVAASGCAATRTVTVNPSPTVSCTAPVCAGQSTTISCTSAGGTWGCAQGTIATVNSDGVATGVAGGTAYITYTLATGCKSMATLTVNAVAALTGPNQICKNLTTTLACATAGGTWSSSNNATATVDAASGIVYGVETGTALITYMGTTGCHATKQVTVNNYNYPVETSPVITPALHNMCLSNQLQLNSPMGGDGTWTSSNGSVIAVSTSIPGKVTANSVGSAIISFTAVNGCVSTYALTVTPLPTITGPATICKGTSVTYLGSIAGGQWFGNNNTVANIGISSGTLNATKEGNVTISYRLYGFDQCSATLAIDVNKCDGAKTAGNATDDDNVLADAGEYNAYPNPSTGAFTIRQANAGDKEVAARVVNYLGQTVYNTNLSLAGGQGSLDLTPVAPGLYLVELGNNNGEKKVLRISIQK